MDQNDVNIRNVTSIITAILMLGWAIIIPLAREEAIKVEIVREVFSETTEPIENPDRGFYSLIGFYITDMEEDYQTKVVHMIQRNAPINLMLVQINLANYADCALSPEALANIGRLFDALRTIKQRLIIRFVYDWNGHADTAEPENIDIIINHMTQLKYVLYANQDRIFLVQGLFTGNWGEMNGTRFGSPEEIRQLAETLRYAAGDDAFLSVRTGYQWRIINDIFDFDVFEIGNVPQIGLYNDGMMGNQTDCGTYSDNTAHDSDPMAIWGREKELEFQNYLCRYVPNGGEVILNNALNDFESAVSTLKTMHVSYLNYDYDKDVLDKWASVTVPNGVYEGMDGLTYIERHLGYRILIHDVQTAYHKPKEQLVLNVDLKNNGFAPVYSEKQVVLQVVDENNTVVHSYLFDQDLRLLYGGDDSKNVLELYHEIPLKDWPTGEFSVYIMITDSGTDEPLILANEQTITQYGYKIAGIKRS